MNGLKPLGAIRASTAMLLCCAMLLLGGAAGYTIRGTQQVQIQPPPEETAQEVPAQPEQEPQAVAFEELFFYRNVTTALQVGAGRGVALLAAQQAGLPLYEYTPMQIKQAVCGNGHADKRQIQQMVKLLLGLRELPKPDDAADALGVAICHANTMGPMAETFRIH